VLCPSDSQLRSLLKSHRCVRLLARRSPTQRNHSRGLRRTERQYDCRVKAENLPTLLLLGSTRAKNATNVLHSRSRAYLSTSNELYQAASPTTKLWPSFTSEEPTLHRVHAHTHQRYAHTYTSPCLSWLLPAPQHCSGCVTRVFPCLPCS
jgi:hypothetical protein